MKRRIQGLNETAHLPADSVPDGIFLVRVDRAQYRWHPGKPFYILRLSVLEPHELAGRVHRLDVTLGRFYAAQCDVGPVTRSAICGSM